MGAPVLESQREALAEAAAGPSSTAQLDGIEVAQAVQDPGGAVPLVAGKRTLVRAYLGLPAGTLTVRGELQAARKASGPWTTVSSFGTAQLDAARSGSTPAQLRSRRENLAYSLNFRLPKKFRRAGTVWLRLGTVRVAGTGVAVQLTGVVGTKTVTMVESPELRLRVLNLRYATGSPPVQYAATKSDLEHLASWLRRAYPVAEVDFSSVTITATAAWPFTSGQANAQVAAVRALDMAAGGDPGTHYYGIVADGGGFMRGSASAIPGTPDPSAVASGPTGPSLFPWDNDGVYGDWYGGHELAHTLGRFHPGFCNGNSQDDPAYPFTAGQLANADGAFTGIDVGDSDLGLPAAALPGTAWHDVMTYCDYQWLSSYTYGGVRDRLVAEAALFPDDDDDDDGATVRAGSEARVSRTPVHVTAVVNLTSRSAQIAYVTPLPGPPARPPVPVDSRLALRVRLADGSARVEPVVFKPDVCRLPGEDETGLVDTVVEVDPGTTGVELLLDGDPVAAFEAGAAPGAAENLRVDRGRAAPAADGARGVTVEGPVLSWQDAGGAAASADAAGVRYAVQASIDRGRTWTTLAVGTTDTSLPLDPEQFADAEQVRFRVLATNGFSQTVTTTDDLPVEDL
jgi:hypothetical protein